MPFLALLLKYVETVPVKYYYHIKFKLLLPENFAIKLFVTLSLHQC